MILLGWEIGTGRRVEIPETGHLAWFGQTQLSGKTTALEAIAFRGELRAVAFVTKQGEGGFLTGRMIPPYFSEPTNDEEQPLWRWVKSILEAGQQRRMNFEESWIIRACEDPRIAHRLADVHENIKELLAGRGHYEEMRGKRNRLMPGIQKKKWIVDRKPVSGINHGVYTSLKAYFDIVMPQLARLPYTKKLHLGPGLNVMDLREYAMETQALVIRSVMEWVYQHEKGVRVIVPEAQDFVPQGKNSPVKMACETLVRKAGANKNFMWLDSQDMAAVDKIMLRACSIVGIGVQTEGHEIERSLAGLFTPALKPVDIARLKVGEFFVRVPEARVSKVYVQPAWMDSELHAQAIAKGEESVASARQMLRAFRDSRKTVIVDDGCRTSGKTTPLPLLHSRVQETPRADTISDPKMLVGEPHALRSYPAPQLQQILSQESPADEEEDNENVPAARPRQSQDEMRLPATVSTSHDSGRSGGEHDYNASGADTLPKNETEGRSSSTRGQVGLSAAPETEGAQETGEVSDVLEETERGVQPERGEAASVETAHRSVASGIADGHVGECTDPRTMERDAETQTDSPQHSSAEALSEGGNPNQQEPGKHENQTTHPGDSRIAGSDAGATSAVEEPPIHAPVPGTSLRSGDGQNRAESEGAMPQETAFEITKRMVGQGHCPTFRTLSKFLEDHAKLIEAHDTLAARANGTKTLPKAEVVGFDAGHGLRFTVPDLEYIYKFVREAAKKDPGVLELLTRRPELRVKVERQTIQVDGTTLRGQLALLVKKGFFDVPKNGNTAFNEVQRLGKKVAKPNVYRELDGLAELGFLTKEDGGYQSVPEMKVEIQK